MPRKKSTKILPSEQGKGRVETFSEGMTRGELGDEAVSLGLSPSFSFSDVRKGLPGGVTSSTRVIGLG